MSGKMQLTVDIVSDVVCPWCIIGYRGLEAAGQIIGDRAQISVRWHSFMLAPMTPPEGQALADYSRERYGATPEQSAKNRVRLIEAGAPLGIDFRYSSESRIYNTRKAHELLTWAGDIGGDQTALKLALFHAYFTDQRNISDEAVLLDIAEGVGLDRAEAAAVLADGRYTAAVNAEIAHWHDQNVTGVPAFIIAGKYMIPGAQDATTFVRVLERIIDKEALAAAA